ncbi:MAG: helix-turn-helix domain-containing protein [Actinomycetota bacterium]
MSDEYIKSLARLRGLRLAAGMTLKQVEIKSRGNWKSVVVGSYERGTRHLSLLKAVELCEFYGADISALGQFGESEVSQALVLDLRQLSKLRELPDEIATITNRLASRITSKRGDRNGTVLSLRELDIETLEVGLGRSRGEVLELLKRRGLLLIERGLPLSH